LIGFGASWNDEPVSKAWDTIAESGMAYNVRQWEMQCANENGMTVSDWYAMDVAEREWKVAAMLLPNVFASLRQAQTEAQMAVLRGRKSV
jgi:hypothetical protein